MKTSSDDLELMEFLDNALFDYIREFLENYAGARKQEEKEKAVYYWGVQEEVVLAIEDDFIAHCTGIMNQFSHS
jgi:hypothetical protein